MEFSILAGKPADLSLLNNAPRLVAAYYARTRKDPVEHYQKLAAEFGTPYYKRIDALATPEQKTRLEGHLDAIVNESQEIVNHALESFVSAYQQREANE
jgi:phosphoglucomutase